MACLSTALRDTRETLKVLSAKEKAELLRAEAAQRGTGSYHRARKEQGVKIHVHGDEAEPKGEEKKEKEKETAGEPEG